MNEHKERNMHQGRKEERKKLRKVDKKGMKETKKEKKRPGTQIRASKH